MPPQSSERAIQPVATAAVSSYLAPISEGHDAETYLVALLTERPTKAYVKLVDNSHQVLAELVCAQLGRAIGLFIPEPMLILVDGRRVPEGSRFRGDHRFWAFASRQVADDAITVESSIRTGRAARILQRWTRFNAAVAFDEWVANEDRNLGNLVYSPRHDDIALIDHGRALAMTESRLFGLKNPAVQVANRLIDEVQLNLSQRMALRKAAQELMEHCQLVDFSALPWQQIESLVRPALAPEDVTCFLRQRIHLTVSLLCHRIGISEIQQITH
ncbi:MAG: hypothetical protein M0Q49_02345 [Porticoccaceae bacterium]|nr:hypothetical protein [Porticoccaceae bacterium]